MTEETFVRELERRADDVRGVPLTFEDVRGRARGIQRRRRAAVVAAAAVAVVALAVPTALLSGGDDGKAPEPAPAIPVAPGSSVLHARALTQPTGATVPIDLDNGNVIQLGVLTDGRIVVATRDPSSISVYGADGAFEERYPVYLNTFTMSAADDTVAWVAKDLSVQVLESGVTEPTTLPGIPTPAEDSGSIDAVLDAEHLLVGDHTTTTGELTPEGVQDLTTSEPFRVEDVSPDGDLWSVSFLPTTENEQYGCSGLYDPGTDEVVARSCDTSGLQFSPDGQHLLGMRGDNNMFGEVSTYDLDLHPVGTFSPDGETTVVSRAGWADATHLVVGVADWETTRWSLVRVSLDGTDPEVVVPEGPGRNPEIVAEFVVSD